MHVQIIQRMDNGRIWEVNMQISDTLKDFDH